MPLAGLGLALVSTGPDGSIRSANSLFGSLTGLSRAQQANRTLQSLFADDNDPLLVKSFVAALQSGHVDAAEFLCQGPGETRFWADVTATPRGADERLVIIRDVTARRAADTALGKIPSHDRLLMERVQAGIVIHKASTEILYANAKATELLGVTHHTVLGAVNTDPRWNFVDEHGQTLPIDEYPVGRAVRTREVVRHQLLGLRRDSDGKEIWILCNAYPVTDASGEVTEVVVSFNDVTKLKQAEQALQRSEERLQLILRGSSDAPWDNDFEHGEAYYSPRWYEMLGYVPGELQDDPDAWSHVIHPEDRPRVLAELQRYLDDPTVDAYEIEFRFVHKTGRAVYALSRAVILRDAEGRARRVAGTNSDITERRALELRLRQSQKMEAIGQLAGGVAHDFNNLLAVINGNLELLRQGVGGPEEAAELVRDALAAADRGAKLTRRLLAFSRQERLEPTAVTVVDTLHGVASILRRVISATIKVDVDCPSEMPQVLVDPGLLENALLNLAINARDAMPDGGQLTLSARAVELRATSDDPGTDSGGLTGSYVQINVRDTGVGMPEEVLAHATEPFYTTKPVGQGTGLGLAMVYGFARQSGGEMSIASSPGAGTTVTLLLPVAPKSATSAAAPPRDEPAPPRTREETVLLVEDDHSVRRTCIRALQRMGFTVHDAEDGPSALRLASTLPRIDLVLTDVIMPGGMSGPDLVSAIRSGRPDIPVIYMSGYHADILDAESTRADFHLLNKPFTIAMLQAAMDRVLPRLAT
ncbi:PAS domain S-box protein [Pseudogemmatithrix spongiicola]|uniref:histidine kinase n=1 Tax=Pseudogemmatithrix spongiicola TaxID=3062599 RepID=A0AA49Q5N8_9BACT|nr:PAS domain S-box protein [Gemmatimonadaceae bacterium 'strain 138']WKW16043.1 PAS domain S-box protein [Gemmatimonadaceae bacterium 'strain 318']